MGSEPVVMVRRSGLIVRASALAAVAVELSDTWTVKFEVPMPKADGVPVMAPAALRVSPGGSVPAETVHV